MLPDKRKDVLVENTPVIGIGKLPTLYVQFPVKWPVESTVVPTYL